MMNDAPDSRSETLAYYLKFFEIHDIEVSLTAWFSHAMPLKHIFRKA